MQAFFFDMDGVLFDSMPHHAVAWEKVMHRHGLPFTAYDTYLQEGRTGESVITECYQHQYGAIPTKEYIHTLYDEKTHLFEQQGEVHAIPAIDEVLRFLKEQGKQIWVVTGSGQVSLFDRLEHFFPQVFVRERMITAFDVQKGKPDPEPYRLAWERSGEALHACCVVENAPLGVRSAKAAGLFTIAVNTGILSRQDLLREQPDIVLDDMQQLLTFVQVQTYLATHILPYYDTFDKGHQRDHAAHVVHESLALVRDLELQHTQPFDAIPVARAYLMAYTIAVYHDLGLRIDREHHHLHSGTMLAADEALPQWFTAEEIQLMREAVEDHRASSKHAPRNIFGCIVAEADRDIEPHTILRRTMQYGMRNYPNLDFEEQFERTLQHLHEKYDEGGYIRLWMHSERNEKGLKALREIIHNTPLLRSICWSIYQKETDTHQPL